MNALALYLDGLPDAQRETALHIVREHHLSDADPLLALLALMRLRDSAFAAGLETLADQMARDIADLRADLAVTREAPAAIIAAAKAVTLDAEAARKAAAEIAVHAEALRNANLRNVAFLIMLAVIVGIALGVVVGKFWL